MAGGSFAGGRARIVVGGEYSKEGLVEDFDTRDWGRRRYNFIPNPFFNTNPALSNGLPATIATSNVLYSMNPAGVITVVHPLQGMQFDANGNLVPFQFGELYNRARPSTLMVGGDPSVVYPYGANRSPILTPSEHAAALAHAEYDLSDSLTFQAELSYSNVIGGPTQSAFRNDQNGAIRINRDNAYLTPATAAMMDAAAVAFLPVSRVDIELGDSSVYVSRNHTLRAFAGLKGDFGRWDYDAFFDYGRTAGRLDSPIQRILARWTQSVDAVRAPAGVPGIAAGTIVCRSTLTNLTNGCIPSNVMGAGKISEQAANWINTAVWQTRAFTQSHFGANIRGPLLTAWAGDIVVAAGVEYRINTSEGTADPFSVAGALQTIVASVLPPTTQRVTEGYAEIAIPLLKDSPLGKSLVVDGAIRRTHYSLSGNATTWKVGVVYEPSDEYMVRVTRSRDIRAPSASELNPNTRITTQSQADPKYNVAYLIPGVSGGNPNLALERANTITIGVVFQPNWIPRLRMSLDYYDITVRDAIDVISVTQAIQLCRAGASGVCDLGTDGAGNLDRILRVYATYQNVNTLHARGFEFVGSYSADLAGGTLNLAVNGNYVDTLSTTLPNGTVREFADVTGNAGQASALFGVPKWRADAVATFERPRWSVTTQFQYIPPALLSRDFIGPHQEGYSVNLPNSINNNRVSSSYYVNLSARVTLIDDGERTFEMFGSINNLFDKDPPSNLRYNGNPVYFDGIGRFFRVGIRGRM
jgi:outer membrane receptor protein involved in Fe transport